MAVKRKISVRKMLRVFVTLIVTSGCIVAVLGASKMQQQHKLHGVYLHIRNEKQYQFLDKKALLKDIVEKKNVSVNHTLIGKLDINGVEAEAYKNPWVANTEVYVDNNRDMHIYVTQRVPVARLFFENGQSVYLDTALHMLPLSDLFSYYTTVVTNVPWYNNDSANKNLRGAIIGLVQYVDKNPFWRAQIEQIAVTPDGKFEMYPLLGTHRIIFGDTTGMKWKFDNLFAFYKGILNRIGWDKYEIVDVRFKDQVVASPSLPWKMPPKNAMSNMDWLKSIMDAQPKVDTNLMKEAIERGPQTLSQSTSPQQVADVNTPAPKKESKPQKPVVPSPQVIKKTVQQPVTAVHATPDKKLEKKTEVKTINKTKQADKPKYIYQEKANQ